MKLTIIYDNEVCKDGLERKWGFSCLIEDGEYRLLFDTGGDETILLDNMKKLNISPDSFNSIFISHGHWDHTGGLAEMLRLNKDALLYIPPSCLKLEIKIPSSFIKLSERDNIIVVREAQQLYKNIYSTGELGNEEQSLILKTEKGLVIVVGCSHPGLDRILKTAGQFGEVYAVIGGLHYFKEYELLNDIKLICPTHCTKYSMEIMDRYPEKSITGGAGKVIKL